MLCARFLPSTPRSSSPLSSVPVTLLSRSLSGRMTPRYTPALIDVFLTSSLYGLRVARPRAQDLHVVARAELLWHAHERRGDRRARHTQHRRVALCGCDAHTRLDVQAAFVAKRPVRSVQQLAVARQLEAQRLAGGAGGAERRGRLPPARELVDAPRRLQVGRIPLSCRQIIEGCPAECGGDSLPSLELEADRRAGQRTALRPGGGGEFVHIGVHPLRRVGQRAVKGPPVGLCERVRAHEHLRLASIAEHLQPGLRRHEAAQVAMDRHLDTQRAVLARLCAPGGRHAGDHALGGLAEAAEVLLCSFGDAVCRRRRPPCERLRAGALLGPQLRPRHARRERGGDVGPHETLASRTLVVAQRRAQGPVACAHRLRLRAIIEERRGTHPAQPRPHVPIQLCHQRRDCVWVGGGAVQRERVWPLQRAHRRVARSERRKTLHPLRRRPPTRLLAAVEGCDVLRPLAQVEAWQMVRHQRRPSGAHADIERHVWHW
mmetsp:Transcript_11005/g.36143  ORF Transcript_11005/g.36143 Transcript_11005/m.36143 type:complete len:489 (-) Transcript_11005:83-1549(-)